MQHAVRLHQMIRTSFLYPRPLQRFLVENIAEAPDWVANEPDGS
jgi:hypothetical protein